MADTNPSNFANLPKERVQEIASMGGKASHKNDGDANDHNKTSPAPEGRNPDGTFTKGSEAAKEAGHKGGLHSHDGDHVKESEANGRREDGTFLPGSEAAKQAGHIGGLHAHGKEDGEKAQDETNGRRDDGTFLPGSEAAKEAGHKGGLAAAASH